MYGNEKVGRWNHRSVSRADDLHGGSAHASGERQRRARTGRRGPVGLLAVTALVFACTEARTPMEPMAPGTGSRATVVADYDPAIVAVEDALDRVLAGMPESGAATSLRYALEDVLAAFNGPGAVKAAAAIARAGATLQAYRDENEPVGDEAELDVVELAIAAAGKAVAGGA